MALLIISIIASAYVWYFIGMTVNLAAGAILGVAGAHIAQIFAWAGMVFAVVLFTMTLVSGVNKATKQEEELAKLLDGTEKE